MTEASFLQLARQAYDVLAVEHTDLVRWDPTLASLPVDRALLGVFAELVRAARDVPVIDVGCGSGRIARILADFGLDVFGVDLSRKWSGWLGARTRISGSPPARCWRSRWRTHPSAAD
jgi:2-polyprenyl-3-methyl-5-hydroxy-6-metoxy-1,4-benzoquinol methylase